MKNTDTFRSRFASGPSFPSSRALFFALAAPLMTGMASASTLLVDFSDSVGNVDATAAGFIFTDGAGPKINTYTYGTQGYTGLSFDQGSGVSVRLEGFTTTTGLVTTGTVRLLDRNDANADLVSDFATIEPGSGVPSTGLQLSITGLAAGTYSFSSFHDDTSNQTGVMDAQYSLDGGASWINLVDNASYNSGATVALNNVTVDATNGLILRYLAGGNLFGGNGQTTNGTNNNRLVPLNYFNLQAVPEPSDYGLIGAGALAAIAMVRRRRKLAGEAA